MNKILMASALIIAAAIVFLPSGLTGLFTPLRGFSCHDCNVLLITIDTVRADHVSSYGYFRKTTPVIDSLAEQGVLFEEAYIQIPFTPPSHWSIMTGLYPFHHGMYLPTNTSRLETIATRLRRDGYDTAAIVSSYMVSRISNGFSFFDSPNTERHYIPAENVTDRAISWMRNSKQPFFLWVHYFDAHSPYAPPHEFDIYNYSLEQAYADERYSLAGVDNFNTIRHDIEKYDGEINYVDHEIGRLVRYLEESGHIDSTLIVIVSDHGENFGEHMFRDFGYEFSGPCLFHDKTLYQEEVHVPLIILNPAAPHYSGTRIHSIVESVDILPTILDSLGFPAPRGIDGMSLKPLIEGNASGFGRAFFQIRPGERGTFAYGVVNPQWKFIRTGLSLNSSGGIKESRLLFSRINDPREKINLAGENAHVADEMDKELSSMLGTSLGESVYIDSRAEEILRMFGYIK